MLQYVFCEKWAGQKWRTFQQAGKNEGSDFKKITALPEIRESQAGYFMKFRGVYYKRLWKNSLREDE
jgi:hypothetical protein